MKTLLIALVISLLASCGNDIGDMEPVRTVTIWAEDSSWVMTKYIYSEADNRRFLSETGINLNDSSTTTLTGDYYNLPDSFIIVEREVTLPDPGTVK
jgi:hypothetical protein